MRSVLTTVPIVDFVVLEEPKTFDIVTSAECVSTYRFMTRIIARLVNTEAIALFVRNTSSAVAALHTKCPVDMRFTGIASGSLQLMIVVAQYAKRQPKLANG